MKIIEKMNALHKTEKQIGVKFLTPEFEVISYLVCNGPDIAGNIMKSTRASYANFYSIMKKLVEMGILKKDNGLPDKRKTIYCVNDDIRYMLIEELK